MMPCRERQRTLSTLFRTDQAENAQSKANGTTSDGAKSGLEVISIRLNQILEYFAAFLCGDVLYFAKKVHSFILLIKAKYLKENGMDAVQFGGVEFGVDRGIVDTEFLYRGLRNKLTYYWKSRNVLSSVRAQHSGTLVTTCR